MLTHNSKKILKLSLSGFLILIIAVYSFLKTKDLIFGVKISVLGIENFKSYNESILSLSGTAKNSNFLSLNDREIFINKEGSWKEQLLLIPGYNIISFKAKDKFGHAVEKNYQVYLKSSS